MTTNQVLLVVFGVLTTLLMLGAGISKITGQTAMRESADHFSIPWPRYRLIGFAEVAAAIAIVIGFWVHGLGLLAGIAVVLLMIGAISYHVRFHDPAKVAAGAVAGLIFSLGLVITQAIALAN